MGTSTEELQRTAWRELYEMLSADVELNTAAQACKNAADAETADDLYIDGL